jgi:hypothetical protein
MDAAYGAFPVEAGQKQLSEDSMKHCKFNTTSAALLLIVFTPLVSQAQTPVIADAKVNSSARPG